MDYKKINEHLKDLENFRAINTPVVKKIVNEISSDYSSQGDSNEIYEVYDIGLEEGLCILLEIGSDSYGDEEFIRGVKFVKAQKKTIVTYEFE